MSTRVENRTNVAERAGDAWKPPALVAPRTAFQRWTAGARRYFDLQAGSIWNDVSDLVSGARGKVVDVGCGGQPYRELLPSSVEYQGIDIAEAGGAFGYQTPDTIYFGGDDWP